LKEVISDLCIEVVCTMRVIGLIRNFFLRRKEKTLVSNHSRTFLVRNSELLKRKRIDRACVGNKVDRKDVYAACVGAEALNIVVKGPF